MFAHDKMKQTIIIGLILLTSIVVGCTTPVEGNIVIKMEDKADMTLEEYEALKYQITIDCNWVINQNDSSEPTLDFAIKEDVIDLCYNVFPELQDDIFTGEIVEGNINDSNERLNFDVGSFFVGMWNRKNVTALCITNTSDYDLCFNSNNLSMPDYLVPLGDDTYAFRLPVKKIVEVYDYSE